MKFHSYQKRTWAEVLLESIQHNFDAVRNAVGQAKVCCVIKANAYGHGAERLALLYQERGADYLAVSNIEEAIQLRHAGVHLPVLILGYSDPGCAERLAKNDLTQCVFSRDYAELLSKNAEQAGVVVKVHIKIDTGMGRIGFNGRQSRCEAAELADVESVYRLRGLSPEGIFTHFSSADEGADGEDYTEKQFESFRFVIESLKSKGIDVGICHCANSAAIFEYPRMHLDMVRAGIVLYGVHPSDKLKNRVALKPALRLVTIVDFIKEVQPGESISYGREYVAEKKRRIATLPIGYADGLWRSNYHNGAVVEINGSYAPIVGRICMDQCMVDISEIPDAQIGSEATVYGLSGETSVDRVAQKNGTINYEILCAIGERVPRIYLQDGTIESVQDNIVRGNI